MSKSSSCCARCQRTIIGFEACFIIVKFLWSIAGHVFLYVLFRFHPLYLQPFAKDISHEHAEDISVLILQSKVVVCTEVTAEASWNFAARITESDWKVVGLGGQKYETMFNPPTNSIRDHSDSIGEICKKE
jgi:hypothetical protein